MDVRDHDRRQSVRRQDDRRVRQRERDFMAVQRICEALSHQFDVNRLAEQALQLGLEATETEAGSIIIANPQADELVFRHAIGTKAPHVRGTVIPGSAGLAGTVYRSSEPLVIPDVKQDDRHFSYIDEVYGYKTRDMIVVPLRHGRAKPIGVLEVLNKRNGRLTEEDLGILNVLASVTALVIEHAWLLEKSTLTE